ncbi:GRP family sugar transporter [Furfurilactobacillus siliginis]|uniref:Ribose transporter n=1 Tax=Furfurilactobacillus siliginis TaxID=348151 RepID=A0A0R2L6K2_9LACO|nr:GRP family sugar transporter [Furfurilactobacillus siliginis]KRN97299.1 ribose transporter [Furfurilactobacillus siliginis]GEK28611.1 sugar transporter [Furfurilactobacillus siliginis]
MNIIIGLIPAIAWGILPIVVTKVGGRPVNQILGTTFGTFLVSIIVWLFMRPTTTTGQFWLTVLSGAAWAVGQYLQYMAFQRVGVSKAMPISTGLQLVGTSLLGVLAFGEWGGSVERLVGFIALVIIVVGIVLTTLDGKKRGNEARTQSVWPTVAIFVLSTIGYVAYSALPRLANVSGWQGFLPQGLGMALMALLLALFTAGPKVLSEKVTWLSLLDGLVFSIAALTYLISAQRNGVATGFTLSQMNVVLATIGGIVVLHERRTPRGLVWTVIGLVLVVVGGIVIGNMAA